MPTSNVGLPTLVLPVGANPHGDPISLQFVGRAFDDAKVLGFGYALEQQLGGAGHLAPATAPQARVRDRGTPAPVGGTVPGHAGADARRAGDVRRVHAGRGEGVHGATTANVISTAGDATLTVSDPSRVGPGHLVNGAFSLPAPLLAGGSLLPATLKTWTAPSPTTPVPIAFKQLDQRHRPAADGHVHQDAHVHAVNHDAP